MKKEKILSSVREYLKIMNIEYDTFKSWCCGHGFCFLCGVNFKKIPLSTSGCCMRCYSKACKPGKKTPVFMTGFEKGEIEES